MKSYYMRPIAMVNNDIPPKANCKVGSYVNTIIIKNINDTRYVAFKATVINISTIKELYECIHKYSNNSNIVVEISNDIFIYHIMCLMHDNFLIYNTKTRELLTVYEYVHKVFDVLEYQINMSQIKMLLACYIFITKSFNLPWAVADIIKLINKSDSLFNVLLKYFDKNMVKYGVNGKLINALVAYITKHYNKDHYSDDYVFEPCNLKVTPNDIVNALGMLV